MKFNFVWEWWSNFCLRYPFLSRFKEFWNCCRKRRKLFKLISPSVYRSTLVQRSIWTNLVHLINSNFKALERDESLTNEERIFSYDIIKRSDYQLIINDEIILIGLIILRFIKSVYMKDWESQIMEIILRN